MIVFRATYQEATSLLRFLCRNFFKKERRAGTSRQREHLLYGVDRCITPAILLLYDRPRLDRNIVDQICGVTFNSAYYVCELI